VRTLRLQYPLRLVCRVLDVSRSGYYAWQNRRPSKRAQENARLEVAIQAAHVRTRQTYGPERLQAELRADGFPAGVGRIKRLRKKLGLRCQQVRRFTRTTDSTHALPVAETCWLRPLPPGNRIRRGLPILPMVRPANEARLSGAELLEHVWNAWLDEGVWQ